MNRVRVLIVEDEFIVGEDIRTSLEKLDYNVVGVVRSGEEAVEWMKKDPPDILLMDIRLRAGMDGITAAGIIRTLVNIPLIYVTAHSDKATFERAKKTLPHAYILKPFNLESLYTAIELALYNFAESHLAADSIPMDEPEPKPGHYLFNSAIFVKMSKGFEKVRFEDICFIKADGSYSRVHTSTRDYILAINLNAVLKRLGRPEFLRVHRAFAVNLNNIDRVEGATLSVRQHVIPVSRKVRETLLKKLKYL